jgi:diaminopimelate decarboxylase
VGPAGALLARVLYRKQSGRKRFLVLDAAMNDLLRPALYGAHHEIVPVQRTRRRRQRFDVVGPVCETGDFLALDRMLPELHPGDLVAILDAGAYGMAQASNYNSRPRPPEVLVEGEQARLIRRRETAADLMRLET